MTASEGISQGLLRTLRGPIRHDAELGIRYGAAPDGRLALALPWAPFLAQGGDEGAISSGALATLVDTISGIASMATLDFRESVATIDLRIDYVRDPERGAGCVASAWPVEVIGSEGRGSVLMRAEVRPEGGGDLIALGFGRFIRRPLPSAGDGGSKLPPPNGPAIAADYPSMMGFSEDEDGRLTMAYRPGLVGNPSLPSVHGGAVAAHLQAAAEAAVEKACPGGMRLATATFGFLRFAGAADLHAESDVDRLGASVAYVRARSWQTPDELNATGTFTFVRR